MERTSEKKNYFEKKERETDLRHSQFEFVHTYELRGRYEPAHIP